MEADLIRLEGLEEFAHHLPRVLVSRAVHVEGTRVNRQKQRLLSAAFLGSSVAFASRGSCSSIRKHVRLILNDLPRSVVRGGWLTGNQRGVYLGRVVGFILQSRLLLGRTGRLRVLTGLLNRTTLAVRSLVTRGQNLLLRIVRHCGSLRPGLTRLHRQARAYKRVLVHSAPADLGRLV